MIKYKISNEQIKSVMRLVGLAPENKSTCNRKKLLSRKAKEFGLTNTKFYVDDGYMGTNFNRPAFQQLLEDIEMGYIGAVIVKDLSRL